MESSLFLVEIGGNDYIHPLFQNKTLGWVMLGIIMTWLFELLHIGHVHVCHVRSLCHPKRDVFS